MSYQPVSLQDNAVINNAAAAASLISGPHTNADGSDAMKVPVATSKPMMEVIAPATLPEGYEFEVMYGDQQKQTIKVKVPLGGVEKGQTFLAPFPTKLEQTLTGVHIPVGHWRDDICDCFRHGVCHATLWTSMCCTFLAAGQVIRRMQLDWSGNVTDNAKEKAIAFPTIFTATCIYFVGQYSLDIIFNMCDPNYGHEDDDSWEEVPLPSSAVLALSLYWIWHITYWIGTTSILIQTRRTVRQRYGIPAQECEDACCSVCCHCCVAAQMLRHTTDYEIYPSRLCTDTGLPPHAPAIV